MEPDNTAIWSRARRVSTLVTFWKAREGYRGERHWVLDV